MLRWPIHHGVDDCGAVAYNNFDYQFGCGVGKRHVAVDDDFVDNTRPCVVTPYLTDLEKLMNDQCRLFLSVMPFDMHMVVHIHRRMLSQGTDEITCATK